MSKEFQSRKVLGKKEYLYEQPEHAVKEIIRSKWQVWLKDWINHQCYIWT